MHYGLGKDKDSLSKFLKEEGSSGKSPEEKLTIKKSIVVSMEGEIVVLKNTND